MIKIKICNEEFNVSEIFCLLTLIKLRDLVIIVRLSVISLRDKKEEESKKYIYYRAYTCTGQTGRTRQEHKTS